MNVPQRIAVLALAAALNACGGSPNTPGGPVVNSGGGADPPPTKLVAVKVRVSIPGNNAGGLAPGYVSPHTESIVIELASVNGGGATGVNATTIETFADAHACSQSGGETVCNGTTQGSPGDDVFSVTSYSGRNATGSILSVGNVKATIGRMGGSVAIDSRTNSIDGVIASLKLSLDPSRGKRGTKSDSALTLLAYDASGAQITGSSPFEIPISLTVEGAGGKAFLLHDGSRTGTSLTITKPSSGIRLSYDGDSQASPVTVAASVSGPSAIGAGAHFALKGKQPPPPVGTIYALNIGSTYGTSATVTEYDGTASGNAAPARVLQLDKKLYARSIAVDGNANLYVGYFDNAQGFSASSGLPDKGNVVYVYPPGASGTTGPSAILTADQSSGTTIFPLYMAFDASGNFVTYGATDVDGNNGNAAVLAYAPNPSGAAAPQHGWNFASPQIRYAGPTGLALDNSGNFYVNGALHTSLGPAYGLYTNLAADIGNPNSNPARVIQWNGYSQLQPGLTTNVQLDGSGEIMIANSTVVGGSGSYACQGRTNVFSAGSGGGTEPQEKPLRVLTLEDVYTLNYLCSSPRSPLSQFFPSIALYGTALFVADDFNNAIDEYPASAGGTVKATVRITGSSTQLDAPTAIVVTQASERAKARSVTGGSRMPVRSPGHPLMQQQAQQGTTHE